MLSETRDEDAATAFFTGTIRNNGWPDQVVIDRGGASAIHIYFSKTSKHFKNKGSV